MRRILVIALFLSIPMALVGCSNASDMAAEFPCDYTTKVDRFSTNGYLTDIAYSTYPTWYAGAWTKFTGGEVDVIAEWGRLILARNGFNDEDQIELGSTIKIPARCEDFGGDAKPQSSD